MKTNIIKLTGNISDRKKIKQAALVIRRGGIVAFPTETVYGLGANALDTRAVKKIFKAKGRPSDNPLIVHVARKKDFSRLAVEVIPAAKKLISKFCPGPLTLVLKKSKLISSAVSAGLDTVAIRLPSHPVARRLIKESKVPIAAPSANLSGKPSPTDAEHVIEDLNGKIDVIIGAGKTKIGVESTVVDMTTNPPTLLRPGGVTREELQRVVGNIATHFGKRDQIAKSPGMKYRHYAPNAKLILIEGKLAQVIRKIKKQVRRYHRQRKLVGIMTLRRGHTYNADAVILVGTTPAAVAKNLFRALREFDKRHVDIILAEGVAERGMGLAVMNRLRKAAATRVRPR